MAELADKRRLKPVLRGVFYRARCCTKASGYIYAIAPCRACGIARIAMKKPTRKPPDICQVCLHAEANDNLGNADDFAAP
jgi:hypothetical protein